MNRELIEDFRLRVRKNDWVYHQYKNVDGRNKWNIICSAMDWISVSVGEIDINNLAKNNSNDASILMMKFISCVDVMWEGIQQLHRVFFKTSHIPFEGISEIFTDKLVSKDDNNYFKTIRACFSAHPVNIDENITPVGTNSPTTPTCKDRWYASWSGYWSGNKDFSVMLYSNNPKQKAIFFDISFAELMHFAETRYNYLKNIIVEIDRQQAEYNHTQLSKAISKSSNPLEQIEILRRENHIRFESDYYEYVLHQLNLIFCTPITSPQNLPIVETYRVMLLPLIDKIYSNIQSMSYSDLECDSLTEVNFPDTTRYMFSKLCEFVFGEGTPIPVDETYFIDHVTDAIDLTKYETYDELYVLILADWHVNQSPA